MARNKYPEETVEKIVKTATKLFLENGYDNTSIQDIINHLGGLSKGAIYHHFRSKDEIFDAVMNYIHSGKETRVAAVLSNKSLNGLQKLQQVMSSSVFDAAQQTVFTIRLNMMANPKILALQVRSTVEETARLLFYPIVQEAIADGSLAGLLFPEEFTEAFLLLANIWLNPMVFPFTAEETERRCRFLQHIVRSVGITEPLISEEMIVQMKKYAVLYNESWHRMNGAQGDKQSGARDDCPSSAKDGNAGEDAKRL